MLGNRFAAGARLAAIPTLIGLLFMSGGFGLGWCKWLRVESMPMENGVISNSFLKVDVYKDPFKIAVKDKNGVVLLEMVDGIRYTFVHKEKAKEIVAWQFLKESGIEQWKEAKYVVGAEKTDDALLLKLSHRFKGETDVILNFTLEDRKLTVNSEMTGKDMVNRVAISLSSDDRDTYFGMGEHMNSPEHSGSVVRNWSQEGAMGIGNLSKIAPNLSFNPFPLGQDTTYYPMPFFLNTKGYGFLLDDPHYSRWDFKKEKADRVDIVNWNNSFNFIVYYGPAPLDIIEEMTSHIGRITVPKPWAFAPWNVAIGGAEVTRQVAETVRREKIPTSAIWSEDWWWDETTPKLPRSKEWSLNRKRYPDFEKMIEELHRNGLKQLIYFQPYIFMDSDLFKEGAANGYFTMNQDGSPAILSVTFAKKVQIDLTNPEAVKWWQGKLFQKCIDLGVDGWMTDYGEYTPPLSKSHDGRNGWELHNVYPVLWARATREFFERARPNGDYTFFVRAGYIGTPKYASIMWTGDSNTNWEKYDGIPSVISAATSVGISGFPIVATDIAGMHCVMSPPADKELFIRWTELGAMLPVMRNHRGNDFCNNWKFDDDRETLEAYKKYAMLHTALFPYFYTLAYDAARHGWPITRHLALHYSKDPESLKTHYQFLIGDRLLVAPVIKEKARKWIVYFPPGEWIDYFTGKKFSGPAHAEVEAPLDHIPMFVKSGAIIPHFDSRIDTLVEENRADLFGWSDANSSIKFIFYGQGKDTFKLWDGTEVVCEKQPGADGKCEMTNVTTARKYSFQFK